MTDSTRPSKPTRTLGRRVLVHKEGCSARLLSAKAAAVYLGIGTRLLWSLGNSGELATVRIRGRVLFDLGDLDAFIDARKRGGRP